MAFASFLCACRNKLVMWIPRTCLGTDALVVVVVFSLFFIFFSWIAYERHYFFCEQKATIALEENYHASIFGDIYSDTGPKDKPFWDLSQFLRHGRLYVPMDEVFISNEIIDQRAWNQLRSFRFLESLKIQTCQIDPSVRFDFSVFKHLNDLDIIETPLTLRDMRSIGRLSRLEYLCLYETGVTDDWLKYIRELRNLKTLVLGDDITDNSLELLAVLKGLRGLGLPNTQITSGAGTTLEKFKSLEWLDLSDTNINDECLKQLSTLTALETLHLTGTNITDRGVEYLTRLPNLRGLHLSKTLITNASLHTLAQMPSLNRDWVAVENTNVDKAEFKRWQKAKMK